LVLLVAGVVVAQPPKNNVSGARHPNLAAAQRLTKQAWEKIVAALEVNEGDLAGHAQRAEDLLDQANNESNWQRKSPTDIRSRERTLVQSPFSTDGIVLVCPSSHAECRRLV
jgi:hypothetical protein